jgi:hypothetical protein
VTTWKRQAIDGLTGVFSDKVRKAEDNEAEVKELNAKIGKLVRVPRDDGHRFHGMMGTDSTRRWASIPRDRRQV